MYHTGEIYFVKLYHNGVSDVKYFDNLSYADKYFDNLFYAHLMLMINSLTIYFMLIIIS